MYGSAMPVGASLSRYDSWASTHLACLSCLAWGCYRGENCRFGLLRHQARSVWVVVFIVIVGPIDFTVSVVILSKNGPPILSVASENLVKLHP
jgi:hypothetical protein